MKFNLYRRKNVNSTHTLIYHHLGLGDHILISGGIKYLRRVGVLGPAVCICRAQYYESVKQLYGDLDNFELLIINNETEVDQISNNWKGKKLTIGFENLQDWNHFDKDFYRILNVNFEERWNSFTIPRDYMEEANLLNEIKLPEKFAFVHDDQARGYLINDNFIRQDLKIIKPYLTKSIFDWVPVLEKAKEIHCICSSFKHLTDSLENVSAELFYHHSYVNSGKPRETSITSSRKNWKII